MFFVRRSGAVQHTESRAAGLLYVQSCGSEAIQRLITGYSFK